MKYGHKPLLPILVLAVLILVSSICRAEYIHHPSVITGQQWQQLTSDKDFDYQHTKEVAQKKQSDTNAITQAFLFLYSFFTSSLGRFIVWLLFFILLGRILFKVFFNDRLFASNSKKLKTDEMGMQDNMEENLLTVDWEQLMQQAAKEDNWILAIKYSYIRLLQLMQQKELIDFRGDKTNRDYYNELTDSSYKKPFRQLSSFYEYAWYGRYPLSQQQYEDYMQKFQSLKNRLTS